MRLYYMTTLETAEKYILPERRMKASTFDKLNDPFELLSASRGDGLQRKIFTRLREYWVKNLGIICTAKDWKSPVMWAYSPVRN